MTMSIDKANRNNAQAKRNMEERRLDRLKRDKDELDRMLAVRKLKVDAKKHEQKLSQIKAEGKKEQARIDDKYKHIQLEITRAKVKTAKLKVRK